MSAWDALLGLLVGFSIGLWGMFRLQRYYLKRIFKTPKTEAKR